MKFILCAVLGLYSVGIVVYSISELYQADAGCATCYTKEHAFQGGAGTTGPNNRVVNIRYETTGSGAFTGSDATTVGQALNASSADWNSATDKDGNKTPFNFQPSQSISPNQANINVVLVNQVPGGSSSACLGLFAQKDSNGNVTGGTLYVTKRALANLTVDQLKLLIDHELGHFMGLADNYNNAQCDSIMSQAHDGCVPYAKGIQTGDVAKVNDYVNGTGCSRERGVKPVHVDDGGFTGPDPIPYYNPQTCYFYYDAYDIYVSCVDCRGGQRYVGTVYFLTDVFCF